jgi:hypothetical protein
MAGPDSATFAYFGNHRVTFARCQADLQGRVDATAAGRPCLRVHQLPSIEHSWMLEGAALV